MSLLKVNDLKCHYITDINTVRAVDGISFEIEEGEILGIVGESGSGDNAGQDSAGAFVRNKRTGAV